MTPKNVDDIINDRLAEMTPEERDDYDAELNDTRLALILGDVLRALRQHSGPRRGLLARWLGPRRRRIAQVEARKVDLTLLQLTKAAHAHGHCVTIKVAPEHTSGSDRPVRHSDASGFVFVSSALHSARLEPDSLALTQGSDQP